MIFIYLSKAACCAVGFPRDGTSRCPGTKKNLVPVSLCPGTRAGANVPGQTPLSRDKITFPKEHKKQEKDVPKHENDQISCFRTSFSCFRTSFPVLEHPFPVLEHPFLLCPVLSRVPSRILAVPARPVPWQDFELVPLSLCPGTMKELLSLCPEKLHCPVPLEILVKTSVWAVWAEQHEQ